MTVNMSGIVGIIGYNSSRILLTSLKLLNNVDVCHINPLISECKNYIESGSKLNSNILLSVKSKCGLKTCEFNNLLHGLILLMQTCLKLINTFGLEKTRNILIEELKINEQHITPLIGILKSICLDKIPYPRFLIPESLRWRIDVVISSNRLTKVIQPLILFSLKTSTQLITFECRLTKFFQLRLATANILQEFHRIEEKKKLSG